MEKNKIYRENEIQANNYSGLSILILAIIFAIAWGLNFFNILDAGEKDMTILMLVIIPLMLIPYILNKHFKGEKVWLKYILLTASVVGVIAMNAMLTYSVVLIAIFPIILSCHYYSKKITICTAIAVAVGLAFSTIMGTYHGILDFNNVCMNPGAVVTVITNFEDAVLDGPINYAATMMMGLQYIYIPQLLILSILTPVCYTISTRTRKLISNNDAVIRKEERISTELSVASEIQQAMLPRDILISGKNESFDLYASMVPAKEVGGDFYDYFEIDDSHFVVVMADVSGKGVPSAMFMVIAKTILKEKLKTGLSIEKAFADMNNQICERNEKCMFVTMWAAVVDVTNGQVQFVNAGHNPPIIKHEDKKPRFIKEISGLIVGLMEDIEYVKYTMQLTEGDLLFLYTDGVTEAMDKDENQYGDDRLSYAIDSRAGLSSKEVVVGISKNMLEFVRGEEQFDDITMLALKWIG